MSTTATSYRLQVPAVPPKPTPGCPSCADLARRRAQAAAVGDYSQASDCNIWIGRHDYHQPPISR
ncbi:hypothetical protein P1S61_21595 [Streptomyces sp. ME08-AFT2]|uniref:hypothetical protein n=1 Tax=Streptomyces sp. ME08-AFT2 TaxID=3028683 RepID=UPI0029B654B4|nr:hypothetical protein [Streptomyces sp. ME08-AFT2]MDX3311609.1 hypothetical protein [Streptomyces sp. ME08-AFT2]